MAESGEKEKPVTVRPATRADVPVIASFNVKMAWETESLKLDEATVLAGVGAVLADDRRGHYFVADFDGQVVGCLLVTHEWSDWRNGDMWWIQSVYVDQAARRRGVFKALCDAVEHEARRHNARALRLYVERHNDRAKQTYARLGFDVTDYDIMHKPL